MNQKINQYFALQKEIFDYFGYVEDWVSIPLDDRREMYWKLDGQEFNGSVMYSPDKDFPEEQLYLDEIYTQRFLPKWVYRTEDLTMICVDTHTDGNKFLAIFDSKKEICK